MKATFRDVKSHEHVMGFLSPGDHAGDVALLENSPRPVTFVATAAGTILELPATAFHCLIDKHARLMRNLFRTLGGRFREFAGISKRRPACPVLAVVGDREKETGAVSVRARSGEDLGSMSVADFAKRLESEGARP